MIVATAPELPPGSGDGDAPWREGDALGEIPADGRVDLCASTWLAPETVTSSALLLRSGSAVFDARVSLALEPTRSLGGSEPLVGAEAAATAARCPGSVLGVAPAGGRFREGAVYRVTLDESILGWNGERLDGVPPAFSVSSTAGATYTLEFSVGPPLVPDGALPSPPPGPTLAELFAEGGPLDPTRGTCSCHQTSEDLAAAVLDLSSPAAAYASLLDPVSGDPDHRGPRVVAFDAARSLLVQKLVHVDGHALAGLRGDPMPPEGPLDPADKAAIAAWIDAGALP